MIEVFKTDINNHYQAVEVVQRIRKSFKNYLVNFDLEDCDNILRIESKEGAVELESIINLLAEIGHRAEVLVDDVVPAVDNSFLSLLNDPGSDKH